MKKQLTLLLILFFPLLLHSQKRPLALTHVTVIDMASENIRPDMTVVITGNRITSIRKRAGLPPNATVIDASGKYLIPGLWDMHVHIRNQENISFPLFLANGVTGIREMHYPGRCFTAAKWRDSINNGNLIAPRIGIVAGCIVNGPGDNRGWGFLEVTTAAEARHTVQLLKYSGADFIKVYNRLSPITYRAITQEAKKLNMPVAGHIPWFSTLQDCISSGQSSFEHLMDFHKYCSNKESVLLQTYLDSITKINGGISISLLESAYESFDSAKAFAVASLLHQKKVWVCPTMKNGEVTYLRSYLTAAGIDHLKNVALSIQEKWKPKNLVVRSLEDSMFWSKLYYREAQILKIFHQANVNIIAGTDTSPTRYVLPGYSLQDELVLFVQEGFTNFEALKTATVNPALFLNRSDELGTVEKGKLADLVLLDANPLEDIRNTQKINAVIINGRLLQRNDLDKIMKQAENAAKK
jgi:imidazolonepropionase-like amidohydrolase